MDSNVGGLISTVLKALGHVKSNPGMRSYLTGDINEAVAAIAQQFGVDAPAPLGTEDDDYSDLENWLKDTEKALKNEEPGSNGEAGSIEKAGQIRAKRDGMPHDCTFLYTDGMQHTVALIPVELIFTEKIESAREKVINETPQWLKYHLIYDNIPLIKLAPHRSLYRFFIDGKVKPGRYIAWYNNIFKTRNMTPEYNESDLLTKTYNEFVFMQEELSYNGLRFFIESPVQVEWNPRGYFNLRDGHHRAAFLLEMGFRFIPAVVSDESYAAWRNDEAAAEVLSTIHETNRTEFYTPILNPYFIKQKIIYRENFSRGRLFRIVEAMNDIRPAGKRVLDAGANLCYMGQHFYREGADVACLEPDELHYRLALPLRRLCYGDYEIRKCFFEDYEADKPFDIGILLTVLYHYVDKPEILDKFIESINRNVTSLIIWESGEDYEREKELLLARSKFKHYRHLSYTFGTGKLRELGMFMADPDYLGGGDHGADNEYS